MGRVRSELGWFDLVLATALVAILVADGLLNLFPGWFGHFKERMQAAWVKRHPGERSTDRHLFGTVNLLLGLAATTVAAVVYLYRPMETRWVALSGLLAAVIMTVLIVACKSEERRRRSKAG